MVCLSSRCVHSLAGVLAALLLAACGPEPRSKDAPTLDHAAYVWSPQWGPEASLAVGVDRLPSEISRLKVYIGTTHFPGGTQAFALDWKALAGSGRTLTLVVASGPAAVNFRNAPDLGPAGDLLAQALSEARAASAKVDRVQLDLECPPSKLAGYVKALGPFRARFPGLETVISVLPSWIKESELPALVAACDRFSLHLGPGYGLGGVHSRTDFKAAERWVSEVATLGRPFRLGLPITSHYLCRDENGTLLGSVPVGRMPPAGTSKVEPVVADPVALPAFLRRMEALAPAQLEGFDWLRLPMPGDAGTWSSEGMLAALRGKVVQRSIRASLVPDEGMSRVVVTNDGMVPMPAPLVKVSWRGGEVQACDGFGAWEILLSGGDSFRLRPSESASLVPAGESLTIGWIRFATEPASSEVVLLPR